MDDKTKLIIQTTGLGAVAGMRAALAPAAVSHYLNNHHSDALANSKLGFMQSPVTALITKILSAAEMTGDKLPYTPNRIMLSPLMARIGSGAMVGAAMFQANKQSVVKGAVLGGASALVATFASFYLRKYFDRMPNTIEPVTGAVEDAIAIGSSVALLR